MMKTPEVCNRLGNISPTTLIKYTQMGYLHPTKDKVELFFDSDEVERFAEIYSLKSHLIRNKVLYLIPDTDKHYKPYGAHRKKELVTIDYFEDLDMSFEDLIKGLVRNEFVKVVLDPGKFSEFELAMIHLVAYSNMISVEERIL